MRLAVSMAFCVSLQAYEATLKVPLPDRRYRLSSKSSL